MPQGVNMPSCSCEKCISACKNDPGRLIPEDLPKLAEFLDLSVEELIISSLVLIPLSKKPEVYAYAPAKLKGKRLLAKPGTVIPDYYSKERGTCIFLDENGFCTVHDVKPFECGAYMGCKHTFMGKPYKEKQVEEYFLMKWKKYRK